MPGIAVDGVDEAAKNQTMNGNSSPIAILSPESQRSAKSNLDASIDGVVDTSIEKLYENVCDMQSSDQSPSRQKSILIHNHHLLKVDFLKDTNSSTKKVKPILLKS